jgi:hypothetical protein
MDRRFDTRKIPAAAMMLGLAGLLPFAAAAVSQFVPLPFLPAGFGLQVAIVYGAVILSFLGGIRWGTAIGPYLPERQAMEFITSVLPSLAGFAAVFMPEILGLGLLIASFLMQALWDVTSVEAGRLPRWFGQLRTMLTAGAVIALILVLLKLVI